MMVIDNKFNIGQPVYLKTDKEQLQRLVTKILIEGCLNYCLAQGSSQSWHQEFEISEDVDVLVKS